MKPRPARARAVGGAHDRVASEDSGGPSIRCEPFGPGATHEGVRRLSPDLRRRLARIASRVRFKRGEVLYRQGAPAVACYNIVHGVVAAYRELPSGRRRVLAFLFAEDLAGLAERGRYVNTARSVTAVTAYRLPTGELDALLRRDPRLQYPFFCKIVHELREAQRLAIVLGRRDAVGKVAAFLHLLEREPTTTRAGGGRIFLPMSRTEIAAYLGLTLESVSRACAELKRRHIVAFPDARHARVLDRARFETLIDG